MVVRRAGERGGEDDQGRAVSIAVEVYAHA